MIRTCLFDLGNVLLRFSHERMYAQIASLCHQSSAQVRRTVETADLVTDFECGRVSSDEFHQRFEREFGCTVDSEALIRAIADIFDPDPAMPPILEQLRDSGKRLVLLSNTNETHFDWILQHFDTFDFFDELVLSFRVGAMKPDPAIYEAALQTIQCPPHECFYTDDIAENVAAARNFGLQAEVFQGADNLRFQLHERGIVIE